MNSIGNREAKELICTTHGHELRGGQRRDKREKNIGTTVIAQSIKYT